MYQSVRSESLGVSQQRDPSLLPMHSHLNTERETLLYLRPLFEMQVVEAFDGSYLRVEGIDRPLLNMANFDFLGMGQRKELKEAAVQALDKVK